MRKAVKFLQDVTSAFPPGPNQHHGLMLRDDGPGLTLSIMRGSNYQTFMLDPEDLEREISDVIADIRKLMPIQES